MCTMTSSSFLHYTNWTSGVVFVSMLEDCSLDGVCIAWPKNIFIIGLMYPGTGHLGVLGFRTDGYAGFQVISFRLLE